VVKETKQAGLNVAVVLCDCGGSLSEAINFDKLGGKLPELSAVSKVVCSSRLCDEKQCKKAIGSAVTKTTSRLVIGACNREIFDRPLTEAVVKKGLNTGMVLCTNIREHCGWVCSSKKAATNKAAEILAAAVRKVKLAAAVKTSKSAVNQNVLVLGGGVAALQTAVELSRLGHRVSLVTNSDVPGGQAARHPDLYGYVDSDSARAKQLVQNQVNELIEKTRKNRKIKIYTGASLKLLDGWFGNFNAAISSNGGEQGISAGAVVLGIGSAASPVAEKWSELVDSAQEIAARVGIVMDVLGEQGQDVSAQVLSAAEQLVERYGAEVKIFCRNIRVAAIGLESLYRRIRQAGVIIVKYDKPPSISDKGPVKEITFIDPAAGVEMTEEFDLIIMADAVSNTDSEPAGLIKHFRPGPEGVLQADNIWLLSTKTNREGIFVVGSARGSSELRDAQTDGLAAAGEIHELLKNKKIEVFDDAASVDADKCVLCLTCLRICPYGAIDIDVEAKAASVSPVTCRRCGICVAQCPADAIELPGYTTEQMAAQIGEEPQMTVFACENSALPAATAVGLQGLEYDENIRLIRVPCAGKVDPRQILGALQNGAEKVLVLGCHPESCQYITGSSRAAGRIERINGLLERAGVDKKQVVFAPLASLETGKFLHYVKEPVR